MLLLPYENTGFRDSPGTAARRGAIESVVFLSYPGNWRQKIDLSSYGNKKTIQIISYIRY